jgi:predicted ATPase
MTSFGNSPEVDTKKVVITGGPVAGKSTAVEHLKRTLSGSIIAIPEIATALLSGGYPMPGRNVEWSQGWQDGFQDAVFHTQTAAERVAAVAARQRVGRLVVADRGLLDGAAYFRGGRDEFAGRYGVDVSEVMAGYDAVVHLESLAVRGRRACEEMRVNNPSRLRSYEAVLAFENGVREAWDGHPNRYFVTDHGLDDRLVAVEGIVRALQISSGEA